MTTHLIALAAATLLTAGAAHAGDWREDQTELGLRLTHLSLMDVETDQQLPMGGVGGYLRQRLSRRLGVEGSFDVLGSDEMGADSPGEVTRLTVPFTASVLFYLFPDHPDFQLYFLGGVGLAAHSVEFEALGEGIDFVTPLVQVGVGGQYKFEDVLLDLSIRSMSMARSGDDVERAPLPDERTDLRQVDYQPYTGDRALDGAMVTLGVHWGF